MSTPDERERERRLPLLSLSLSLDSIKENGSKICNIFGCVDEAIYYIYIYISAGQAAQSRIKLYTAGWVRASI